MPNFEYEYDLQNPGQYKAEAEASWKRKQEAGWHVHTANLNYGEVALLWEREAPEKEDEGSTEQGLLSVDWEAGTLTHDGVTYKLVPAGEGPSQTGEQEPPADQAPPAE